MAVLAETKHCREAGTQDRKGTRSQSPWIHIGKGPGQPPQLACRGRLQGSATQVAWSQDRALEAMEHTLAELWIPRETHWQGHKIAAAASQHRGCCGAGRLRSHEVGTEHWTRREHTLAELAVDPAETHWQGPRTAAAASLHKAAAGQGNSGRLESGQSTRRLGNTSSQSSGSRGDTLARAQDSRRS